MSAAVCAPLKGLWHWNGTAESQSVEAVVEDKQLAYIYERYFYFQHAFSLFNRDQRNANLPQTDHKGSVQQNLNAP